MDKTKRDLKKELKELYAAGKKTETPHFVEVPPLSYLMVDGHGTPNNSPIFTEAMGVLYGVSYKVKFMAKEQGKDYTVMPLEGLWWTDPPEAFDVNRKEDWLWTVMILQPEWITGAMIDDAMAAQIRKGAFSEEAAQKARLETMHEGRSVQVLHRGPYAEETPTVKGLHAFAEKEGYDLRAKHHEVYLTSPERSAPENMKTLLRHPVTQR